MLKFRPGETPSWQLKLFADDAETTPLDCRGALIDIVATSLPFTPAVAWFSASLGVADLTITEVQSLSLAARTRHWLRIRVRSAAGEVTIFDDVPVRIE
ncbi:MAG TPA: hypothetical protein VF628_11060 [Allosphingosinicella sp.]|jgi:hypothetical protein